MRERKRFGFVYGVLMSALALVFVLPALLATAQDVSIEEQKAAELLDKYIEATGGMDNYNKINTRFAKSTLDIGAMGVSLDLEVWSVKPDKFYVVATSPALGTIERGTDGTTFWEKSMMTGPRILEGGELDDAREEALFDKFAYWRDTFAKAVYAGEDSVDGKLCDKIVLTNKTGKEQTWYLDKDTHLIDAVKSSFEHQMGTISTTMYFEDYRDVDGILIPFKTRMNVMGQDRVATIDSVAQNIEIPDSLLAIPADIQELIQSQDTTKSE